MLSENLLVSEWRLVYYIVKSDSRQVRKNGFNKRRLMCRGYEGWTVRVPTFPQSNILWQLLKQNRALLDNLWTLTQRYTDDGFPGVRTDRRVSRA